MKGLGFTEEVRDELAHVDPGTDCCRRAELAAVLRLGAVLTLRGSSGSGPATLGVSLLTASGAVARRVRAGFRLEGEKLPEVEVHQRGSLRRTLTYRVAFQDPTGDALEALGLLDVHHRPVEGIPFRFRERGCDRTAYLRGAMLAAGMVSAPAREPHLEIQAPGQRIARELAYLIRQVAGSHAAASQRGEAWRVTVKSGAAIGVMLAKCGAHTAFLRWDQERMRRELRWEANRVANADRANLGRTVEASGRQIARIAQLLGTPAWESFPDELKEVALARLANPELSLAELGGLLDPPVGKATVYRRLNRLIG